MFLSFLISFFKSSPRFAWSPSVDLRDREVFSALIPGTQY
jgi:hypothetical protein